MAINLLLPPFTNIDRRQPIMDNYTGIHNIDNYMLGSPYIQGLQQRSLPLLTTTEASTNTENILLLVNALYKNKKLPIPISNTSQARVAQVWHAPTLHAKLDILKHFGHFETTETRDLTRYWTF